MSEIDKFRAKLLDSFIGSFINIKDEFIAHGRTNQYICLGNCKNELDIQCKVLEWFSRPAYKTAPYSQEWKNEQFHEFMRNGINEFLGTKFSELDMEEIYDKLGNAINHELTVKFVKDGYDLGILKEAKP